MGSNGVDQSVKHLEEGVSSQQVRGDFEMTASVDEVVTWDDKNNQHEQLDNSSSKEAENQRMNSVRRSPVLEISRSKELYVSSSPRKGLEHYITAPVGSHRSLINDDYRMTFSQSMTEKLDRLTEREKQQLIVNLVKIQNDGTVEVDLDKSAPVASEWLELHTAEGRPITLDDTTSRSYKSVPRLKIAILVVGTRGDVQPFLAMAKRLQEFGHHVRLATHANFSTFVKSAGIDFYPLGGDPRVLAGYMARNKGLIPSGPKEISIQRKQLKAIIESLLPACTEPDLETGVPFKAQAIIANPPAYVVNIFVGGICRPTYEFSHPLARVPQSAGYWLSYIVVDLLIWWSIRGYINDFRKRKLKLAPIAYFSTYHGSISHLPTGYMWSPHVVPKPSDWGSLVDVVGYCFLNLGSKYQPQEKFVQWIQKGPKPVYIGFGSMPLEDPHKTTEIILEALKDTGQRGIIDRGWGDLGNITDVPVDVFLLEDCPHDWLFPQCSAVVHHGGAGTTATGLRAGCPTTIVPFFGDQFFWGDRVHQKGLGPAPIPISQLNVENLSNAIRFMLQPEVKSRVLDLAKLIENEDGVAAAVDAFHRHLPPELPILIPPSSDDDEHPNPFEWFFIKIAKWCCLPCGGGL
ncbi:UDP-glucuronosyl/UDP-glucosyltransferase [Parasponia andersonii]|uniref:UDP-glucuronosyl/UDP-glucosyltransferase n=1 Tax=Parasponia andersonii TaxID=3476 RepID=A0A2P5B3Y2_PARAD|nr:UDP-glucuronosyl/UDP-glucosyltransferase [Parasponia andersonii]